MQLGTGHECTLSLPRVINFKLPLQLHQKFTPHSMKNLAFHSLLSWKMIILPILTTSLIHLSLKGWGNVHFEPGSERGGNSTLLSQSYKKLLPKFVWTIKGSTQKYDKVIV